MQYVGYLMFLLGAAGMDSPNMAVPAVMALIGLGILAVSAWKAWKERRKGQYDKTGINGKRHCGNLQRIRKYGLQNNKTA